MRFLDRFVYRNPKLSKGKGRHFSVIYHVILVIGADQILILSDWPCQVFEMHVVEEECDQSSGLQERCLQPGAS